MCVPQAVGDTGEGQARRKCEGGEYYIVLQSKTKYYGVLQSITKYYKDKSSASTWTNFGLVIVILKPN